MMKCATLVAILDDLQQRLNHRKYFLRPGGRYYFFPPPSPFPAQYRVNLLDFQSKFAARFTGGNTCAVEIVFNEFCVIYRLSYYNFRGEIEGEGWTRPIDG